jgi:hypothetical protein
MPTSPMAKVGRSATAEVMNRREFFDMRIMFVWFRWRYKRVYELYALQEAI